MNSFFPAGIDVRDIRSPHDLLIEARQEWMQKTAGQLTLDFDSTSVAGGLKLGL